MNKENLEYTVFENFEDVPQAQLDALCQNCSTTMSYNFWKTIVNSSLNIHKYFFVLFYTNNQPVAFVPCYIIKTDFAIFSPYWFKKILNNIRRIFPNFLTIKVFECGSPVTINTPQFLVADSIDIDIFLKLLNKLLLQFARNNRCFVVTIRDFEDDHEVSHFKESLKSLGYSWLPSFPNTYLNIEWTSMDEYHNSLRSHYRYKLFKRLKINKKNNVTHQLVDNFSDLSTKLCRQWFVVHNNAKELKREVLTPEFYSGISRNMGSNSKALLFYSHGKLTAHALLLRDNDILRWLYVGRNKSENNSLYFYIVHKIIESAIEMKVSKIELGLTTYPIKQFFGATLVPINMALKLTIPAFNPFLTPVYNLIHRSTKYPTKNVFNK